MAQLRDLVESKADMFKVDPRALRVEPGFNVRNFDSPKAQESFAELKESIRADGVLVPLEIRLQGENLFVVSGHRRLMAVMELIGEGVELKTVPAIAEPKTVSAEERTIRLLTLNGGQPLEYEEKAEVVRRLLAYGWTRQQIAQKAGWSAQTVSNYEEYLAAHPEVKQAVQSGELSGSDAVKITREEGERAPETLKAARKVAQDTGKKKITGKSIAKAQGKPSSNVKRDLEAAAEADRKEAQVIAKHLENHPDKLSIGLKMAFDAWLHSPRSPEEMARELRERHGIREGDFIDFTAWMLNIEDAFKAERIAAVEEEAAA